MIRGRHAHRPLWVPALVGAAVVRPHHAPAVVVEHDERCLGLADEQAAQQPLEGCVVAVHVDSVLEED